MSQENVEVVRRYYGALPSLRAADPGDDPAFVDRWFRDYLDADFALHLPGDYPEGGQVLRGRQGAAELVAMFRDAWADWRFEPERFIDADDRVVALVRVVAEGAASGVPIELRTAPPLDRSPRSAGVCSRLPRSRRGPLEAVGLRE